MSEQTEQSVGGDVEQITADPTPENTGGAGALWAKDTKKREKDPKKVAAGKKLAEYNKKAKEALAREMKRNENTEIEYNQEKTNNEYKSWLPELSFTTVLSVVGLGFTAFDLFMRYKEKARDEYSSRIADLSQVPQIPQPSKIPLHLTPKSLGME